MINVIIADHQAIFRVGVAKVLAVEDDIRIVGQPLSSEQMLNGLDHLRAHVLLLCTTFLSHFAEIQAVTLRHGTAILVLAEATDLASAFTAMGAQGVVYRSISGPTIGDAVRRLARGETFVHAPNSAVTEISDDLVGRRVRDRLSEKEIRIVAGVVRDTRTARSPCSSIPPIRQSRTGYGRFSTRSAFPIAWNWRFSCFTIACWRTPRRRCASTPTRPVLSAAELEAFRTRIFRLI